jgi:hypothetical protein
MLGFTSTGTILFTTPLLMFTVVYGLSMDHEAFLVRRIRAITSPATTSAPSPPRWGAPAARSCWPRPSW